MALTRRWRTDVRHLRDTIEQLRGTDHRHVRLVAMDSHANGLLPDLILRLATDHPGHSVDVKIATLDEASSLLLGEAADLAIIHNLAPHRDVLTVMTETLPFGCVVAPGHPLAGRDRVTMQQVTAHPVALQSPSLPIRGYLDGQYEWLFGENGPPVVTDSLQLLKALARAGRYAAFTSELDAATELLDGTLRFVRVRDPGVAPQSVTVAMAARQSSRAVQMIAGVIAEQIEEILSPIRKK